LGDGIDTLEIEPFRLPLGLLRWATLAIRSPARWRPPAPRPIRGSSQSLGLKDEMSRPQLQAWREQTTGPFHLRLLPGDHFFLNSARPLLIHALAQDFLEAKSAPAAWQPSVFSLREGRL